MQRASGQHDDLDRFPSTGSRQGCGRRSVAARHRSRTAARCASRMEPAVRGPWIESPIITDRVRNVAFGVTTVAQLCAREKCSVRQVNMTISLAFLAPNLVKAAVEGR